MTPSRLVRARVLLRKPALNALLLGCAVSALASGRLSARLVLDGAISFAFVPLTQIAALAIVYQTRLRGARQAAAPLTFADSVDRFFADNRPWLIWLVGLAALGSVAPPRRIGAWVPPVELSMLVPIVWSLLIDFTFFRDELGRRRRDAVRDLVCHRAIAWIAASVYFLGIAIWSDQLPALVHRMGR